MLSYTFIAYHTTDHFVMSWDWAQLSQFHAPPVWGCQPLWEPLAQPKAKQGVGRSRPPSCLPRFDPANTNMQGLKLTCCLPLAASFGTSLASPHDMQLSQGGEGGDA